MDYDNFEEVARIDRRLSATHQQFITNELNAVRKLVIQHDQEIAAIGLVVVSMVVLIGYMEWRIRRIENGHSKGNSRAVPKVSGEPDKT